MVKKVFNFSKMGMAVVISLGLMVPAMAERPPEYPTKPSYFWNVDTNVNISAPSSVFYYTNRGETAASVVISVASKAKYDHAICFPGQDWKACRFVTNQPIDYQYVLTLDGRPVMSGTGGGSYGVLLSKGIHTVLLQAQAMDQNGNYVTATRTATIDVGELNQNLPLPCGYYDPNNPNVQLECP